MKTLKRLTHALLPLLAFLSPTSLIGAEEGMKRSGRTVIAEVVAFDQCFMLNRLGSALNTPRIFALRKDVETNEGKALPGYKENSDLIGLAGNVRLKDYKRPRPIVLRANVGDVLEIRFTNLLANKATAGHFAGCHVVGLSLATSIDDDSSWVGENDPPPPPPNPGGGSFALNANENDSATKVYRYFVDAEGVFILYSAADPLGVMGDSNEAGNGLFGCVIVQPPEAEYYRSQVLRTDLIDATYHSSNLPPNMVLRRQPRQPGEAADVQRWLLTTYRTRLHDFVEKNVEVVVGDPEEIQKFTGPLPQEMNSDTFLLRDMQTGKSSKGPIPVQNLRKLQEEGNLRKLQEEGQVIPDGYLFSASTRHPLIDYPITYPGPNTTDSHPHPHARPERWPVLEMLYPEAKSILSALTANAALGIAKDATVYKLKEATVNKYFSAITQLDTGTIPRELWPVLNAWGITDMKETKDMSGITPRVQPQRDYFDLTLDESQRLPRGDTTNFIWLLTGVELSGKKNSAVIIHGNVADFSLRFVEVELQLFHSDPTAIITGPQAEGFGNSRHSPSAFLIPASPDRAKPFREFALGYHNGGAVTQAFPEQNSGPLTTVLRNGNDNFGINYGMAGIATEILANRLGKGPQGCNHDEVDLKFEEFFLSSWAVGDPAMLVDRPANGQKVCPSDKPSYGDRATKAFYPDDPSNVYHSYMGDHVKMRIYNAGESAPHVHHLHAHQWLRSPNSDEASYLDSQLIVPGSAFSLEITHNGSGNRNQTVGDSIFHCHFYPHFAQGMWSLWRVHDVFEEGTPLNPADGRVVDGSADPDKWVRALPDGEITTGTPIPAIVPLPTLAIPPIPPHVRVTQIPELPANPAGGAASVSDMKSWVNISKNNKNPSMGRMVQVQPASFAANGMPQFSNPGYPFFVPGVAGHRPPHPPLDMGWQEKDGVPDLDENGEKKYLDGGLPRHQVIGGQVVREFHTPWDFTKDYIRYDDMEKPVDGAIVAYRVPEDGTPIEKAAMEAHRTRTVRTVQPDGRQGQFIHNGLEPISGAPFADPGVDDEGNAVRTLRKYKAAVIQKDVVLNKAGWHYPQQRFLTLWQDVKPTFDEKRPAQPFFFRANSGETVEYWHTNLVPEYYELDDFQVRTPTDIIGQHIHLVKFDVLASDGAVNGFNYEDGTISADDVRGRIHAITRPFANNPEASYNLFNMSAPKAKNGETAAEKKARENYVAGIDWSSFVAKTPVPTAWKDSYLQKEMTQGNFPENQRLQPPAGQNWDGAMTTIQRFSTDPLLNNQGIDRTVRTVFTHDHFGPSTHQQAGLYAGFLVEPEKSIWRDPVTGGLYYDPVTRTDGGPTGWEAIIEPPNTAESYREFALEFQDLQLAYTKGGANSLTKIEDLTFGKIAAPIESGNAGPPPADLKVSGWMVDGPQSAPRISVTELLLRNGITLTPDAKATADLKGIVDNGPGSLYNYGPDEPAFLLDFNPTTKDLRVRMLKGLTWASPGDNNTPGSAIGRSGQLNPQIISGGNDPGGTYSVNYRNEPLSISVPGAPGNGQVGRVTKGGGKDTDMSFAFASILRPDPWNRDKPDVPVASPDGKVPSLFARPTNADAVNGPWDDKVGFADDTPASGNSAPQKVNEGKVSPWDPYTPLLRGYQGDKVQVRALVGAHTQPHSFTINGVKWLSEMRSENSGYRNAQEMGISEHFEFEFDLPPASTDNDRLYADYLYTPSSGSTGLSNGIWGLLRSFDGNPKAADAAPIDSLRRLPAAANSRPYNPHANIFTPPALPDVEFTISVHKPQAIHYNDIPGQSRKLENTDGIVYTVDQVRTNVSGALQPQAGVSTNPGDPLILRVKAGQWVKVILDQNQIPAGYIAASPTVGLHSQLLAYDISSADGMNAGFNPIQTKERTTGPNQPPLREYWWYAGDLENINGKLTPRPQELGATNLCPAAPLDQDGNGLVGALIVEPAGSQWAPADYVSEQAKILDKDNNLLFHDFVLIQQSNIPFTNQPSGTGSSAVNNRSADLAFRLSNAPTPAPVWQVLSNSLEHAFGGPPNTPTFVAKAGEPVRFRVLQPGGDSINKNIMFEIHGHSWQQEPWIKSSRELGDNAQSNVLGAEILVPHKALNILIDQAGGPNKVPGDYLYYNFVAGDGAWGIFRVLPN